jgi:hypothetical protein
MVFKYADFLIFDSPLPRRPIPVCPFLAREVFRMEEKSAPFTKGMNSAAPGNVRATRQSEVRVLLSFPELRFGPERQVQRAPFLARRHSGRPGWKG